MVADIQLVQNPGSGFERVTPMNAGKPAIEAQQWLDSVAVTINSSLTVADAKAKAAKK